MCVTFWLILGPLVGFRIQKSPPSRSALFFAQICFPLLQLLQKLFVKPAPGEGHTAGGHRWHFVREVIARRALEGDHHAITFLRLGHGVSRKHRIYFDIFHPFMDLE